MKRKVQITYEIEESIVLRQTMPIVAAFCPQCQAVVEMAAPQIIAERLTLTERNIFQLIETGKVHFIEAERVLICLNSIFLLNENSERKQSR